VDNVCRKWPRAVEEAQAAAEGYASSSVKGDGALRSPLPKRCSCKPKVSDNEVAEPRALAPKPSSKDGGRFGGTAGGALCGKVGNELGGPLGGARGGAAFPPNRVGPTIVGAALSGGGTSGPPPP